MTLEELVTLSVPQGFHTCKVRLTVVAHSAGHFSAASHLFSVLQGAGSL